MQSTNEQPSSWFDRPLWNSFNLNWGTILFASILILAVISRFYDLETRVMSHDETSHVYFSWLYQQGRGYSHDPVTHGPLQFHLVAFSYFMFGDNDFTARIPAVLFSIATVAFMWFYRRLIGRAAALIAALLFLISPYILYYGRYVRNEAFVALFGVITLWAILFYLGTGKPRYLYTLAAISALHFATKETAFIYTAQALIFLAFYQIYRLTQQEWEQPEHRKRFLIAILAGIVLLGIGGGLLFGGNFGTIEPATLTSEASTETPLDLQPGVNQPTVPMVFILLGLIAFFTGVYFVLRGFTWKKLKTERAFGILILLATMVLPMLAPFPVKIMGYNPIDYNTSQSITVTAIWIGILSIIAIIIGLLWSRRLWLINAAIFYGIFIVFYTSLFTNGFGFVTGLVGSLGYWIEQQSVNRGSQPWYYYWLLQIPIYEFLPALGTILALIFAPYINKKRYHEPVDQSDQVGSLNGEFYLLDQPDKGDSETKNQLIPGTTIALLLFWSITSLLAYTIAGEKMPWLTVHIAVPMILSASWFLGYLIESINWSDFIKHRGLLVILILPIFFISLLSAFGSLLGPKPPFQGKELEQLRATSTFLLAVITALVSGWGLAYLVKDWKSGQLIRILTLSIFGLLALLTTRSAIRATYINYDYPTEFLVYAHSGRGPKIALSQIEEISRRTTDGLAVKVAYDNETTYPYWWYLRNYLNQDYYGTTPSRTQRDAPIILVGEANYGKIEPVVGQAYNQFDYIRIWWPNQDYYDLTWQRITDALTNPQMRAALFQIWFNRDYSQYAQLTNKDMSLNNWYPSSRMRMYIRKDLVSSLWNYGVGPTAEEIIADPYEGKQLEIAADKIIGSPGTEPGQFTRPRGVAVAPDGTLYIADTENHRIQHLDGDGNVLHMWGSFADSSQGEAPGGTFYEPWGIAVGADGSVYVADTWNHRIQKFTSDGQLIDLWGFFGQAESPLAMWGPRDVTINSLGHILVTDTGNKRVIVFDPDGNVITEFGEAGLALGQFDEPVGLAVGPDDHIYVADTWNQRIQEFNPPVDDLYLAINAWDIVGWYGQSLDNKPFLAVDSTGHVFATDPEGYRVLEFTPDGEFVRYFGNLSTGSDGFGLVGGIDTDENDGLWVADSGNNRIMHFTLP